MEIDSYLKRQFDYDNWANREVIRSLQALAYAPHKAVRLMAHVVAVEFVWLARLRGEQDPPVWPEWNLQQVAEKQNEIAPLLQQYLRTTSSEALDTNVEYKNTKGQLWSNSVIDILTHIIMHSMYHRGQVAMVLRETGIAPPYTDYIQAVRTQMIDE